MNEAASKFKITNETGTHEVEIGLDQYKAAAEAGVSLKEYVNAKYQGNGSMVNSVGTPFEQMMVQSGLLLRNDGLSRAPTMKQVFNNTASLNVAAITRNSGDTSTPSARLLFPEVVMQIIQSELNEDHGDFLGGFNSMVAVNDSVTSPKFDQPVIDVTAPRDSASQPIAQMAEPASMVTIKLTDKSYRIPTFGIGLQIADQALEAVSLPLVNIIMTEQARQERVRVVESHLAAMINGDADRGEVAVTGVNATVYDPTLAMDGKMSQKAWVKWLRANYRKMNITHILCGIDEALAIEGRTGRPVVAGDDPRSPRIDSLFSIENLGINPPKVLLVDNSLTGANTLVGLDSRKAIRRVVNVSASYEAIEQYVMRRMRSLRVDFGETSHKLFTDAWTKMAF